MKNLLEKNERALSADRCKTTPIGRIPPHESLPTAHHREPQSVLSSAHEQSSTQIFDLPHGNDSGEEVKNGDTRKFSMKISRFLLVNDLHRDKLVEIRLFLGVFLNLSVMNCLHLHYTCSVPASSLTGCYMGIAQSGSVTKFLVAGMAARVDGDYARTNGNSPATLHAISMEGNKKQFNMGRYIVT